MELFSAEAVSIEKQVSEWLEHPEYELETTFGTDGRVDATTFITVAKREPLHISGRLAKDHRGVP